MTTLLVTPNNGGTIFQESGNSHCVIRVGYQGDPHDWGAYGNNNNDDTNYLKLWLASPGPWIASIPATYQISSPLTCWPYVNLQSPANNSNENSTLPIVDIKVGSSFSPVGTSPTSPQAALIAEHACRISGLSIDAEFPNADTTCTPSNVNCYIDALWVKAGAVVVDGHSIVEHGYNNVYCPSNDDGGDSGLQLKDSQFSESFGDNVAINCPNVRIIGDLVQLAGTVHTAPEVTNAVGINATAEDLTISNGNVATSLGIGIYLNNATYVSVTGMFIENNGTTYGGAGIEIDTGHTVSVCANHFKTNDIGDNGAQVRFAVNAGDTSFCSNVYQTATTQPNFVYDTPAIGNDVSHIRLYEDPASQHLGVFSGEACMALLYERQIPRSSSCH